MCGFIGILDPESRRGPEALRDAVAGMTSTLVHRGPDDEGSWIDVAAGIALGFRRLAIVDLTPNGHQPMESDDGRLVLVFNGEIYNHDELRKVLVSGGETGFHGTSDTEVLLRSMERWGLKGAIERSVGMFALALWDRRQRRLYLARDRMGEKPLYYGWSDGVFLFGSELKALRAFPGYRAELDRDLIAGYLQDGYIPAPYSIDKGIFKLTAGTILTIDAEGLCPGTVPPPVSYWSVNEAADAGRRERFQGSPEEAVDALDGMIRESIRQQMTADVPIGAFLSGGVDSATVVAVMQSLNPRPIHTFTIGFEEKQHDEAGHAREIARHLGTLHTEFYVTPAEVLGVIPRLPSLFDEPFADSSQVPTYFVSRLARTRVTVGLTGDGGDELFAGYSWYTQVERLWKRFGWLPSSARRATASALTRLSPTGWDRLIAGLGSAGLRGKLGRTTGDRIHKLATILERMDSPDRLHRSLISKWNEPAAIRRGLRRRLHDPHGPALPLSPNLIESLMQRDQAGYLPDDILTKVDRATMAVSLESRAPFLDHRIVEFAWRVPMALKLHEGRQKWLLRRVLDRYVPNPLVDRPKTGFCLPFGSWLRGPLRDWAESLLNEDLLRNDGLFDVATIRRTWQQHQTGERNWPQAIWCLLMFQAWLHSDRPSPTAGSLPAPVERAKARFCHAAP